MLHWTKPPDFKRNSPSIARRRELSESEGKLGRKQLLKQFIPDSAHGKNEFSLTSKNLSIRTLILEHRAWRSVSIPLHYAVIWEGISASIPPRMGTDTSIVEWPIKPAWLHEHEFKECFNVVNLTARSGSYTPRQLFRAFSRNDHWPSASHFWELWSPAVVLKKVSGRRTGRFGGYCRKQGISPRTWWWQEQHLETANQQSKYIIENLINKRHTWIVQTCGPRPGPAAAAPGCPGPGHHAPYNQA